MATPKGSNDILAALKREGITVQEYGSWRTHNRNHVGTFGPVHGVMIHHTVSSGDEGSVALCYNGHSTLPGPLCHGVGRNDGRIALVGHGRANHAGLGDDDVLRAVIAETALPADNEANTDGNRHFYGLEIVNDGNGRDTYPWVQYVAAVKWATVHCRIHGWTERSVIGHKEWQPGKIDPYGPVIGPDGTRFDFTMNRFRADVKAALALPAGGWPRQQEQKEEWEMADFKTELVAALKTPEVKEWLMRALFRTDGVVESPTGPDSANPHWWVESYFVAGYNDTQELKGEVAAVKAKVDSLAVSGVDLDALAEKVADKLAERLAD
jgi:hypothetical protein